VPAHVKRELLQETGGVCANPGCSRTRVQLHHIDEWAVYATHDAARMIAVCPACHDEIHRGRTSISDEDLLRWKALRNPGAASAHFYVKPQSSDAEQAAFMVIGNQPVSGYAAVSAFQLGNQHLEIDLLSDLSTFVIAFRLDDLDGNPAIWADKSHVFWDSSLVTVDSRTGKIEVWGESERFWPMWFRTFLDSRGHPIEERVPLAEFEVTAPGEFTVRGVWASADTVLYLTSDGIAVFKEGQPGRELPTQPDRLAYWFAHDDAGYLNFFGSFG
jgi:hypothetical protein